jgi:hypothetical protein
VESRVREDAPVHIKALAKKPVTETTKEEDAIKCMNNNEDCFIHEGATE